MGESIILTERETEHLFRIIEVSTSISRRHQFFLWSQGELQALLPHGMLICVFDEGSSQPVGIEKFSRTEISDEAFSELCRPDGGIVFRLLSAWDSGRNRPLLLCPGHMGNAAYRHFAVDLERSELVRVAVHGIFDAHGRTSSLFIFTHVPGALTERHAYFLELLVPHLHMALVRMLLHERYHQPGVVAKKRKKLITDRETEILRYVQMGKSNLEIGNLLSISPLTVKNHIQKILRKMNVNNRAHAVAKAMALKITL
ncbi:XrtB/PEP-CTERM-associated transcriptional regulator EpsA [Nitrosovibrio sp. Nv17]|uniref:XrtB/PEP-CTERM-associated transcriptional regulator EpsA n=1 Tax=Nitrosovibrio sp. Nv17 TaxID=1855339 RepID=UPI000908CA8E|nr:XrtB/PEP-CTERM-associated transcriptional regulator EpsA [Nitrosovibrio sp. Nv17]SFW37833.1 transcriptional regulator, LuxR family [Nitrosovibrio sp. Nv17]